MTEELYQGIPVETIRSFTLDASTLEEVRRAAAEMARALAEFGLYRQRYIIGMEEASIHRDGWRPTADLEVCDRCRTRLDAGIAPESLPHTYCWEAAIVSEDSRTNPGPE